MIRAKYGVIGAALAVADHCVGADAEHDEHRDLGRHAGVHFAVVERGHVADHDHRRERDEAADDGPPAERLREQAAHGAEPGDERERAHPPEVPDGSLPLQPDEQPQREGDGELLEHERYFHVPPS